MEVRDPPPRSSNEKATATGTSVKYSEVDRSAESGPAAVESEIRDSIGVQGEMGLGCLPRPTQALQPLRPAEPACVPGI